MHVVRHDAPGHEPVASAVEVEQRVLDDGRDASVAEMALTVAAIQKRLKAVLLFTGSLIRGHMAQLRLELSNQGAGQ